MKSWKISNQPTYKPRTYKFSSHSHILHKVRNDSWIHRSLEHKVITTQVHTEIAEANSFKSHTHTFSSDKKSFKKSFMPVGSHFRQKHQIRNTERTLTRDRCTVCAERSIGSEIILDTPDGTHNDVGHVESHFRPFRYCVSVGAR
jgi:hypothetical protein